MATSRSSSSPHSAVDRACAFCASPEVQERLVTRSFGAGAHLLVIERIPMWSCPSCGESYFSARTLHGVERIKALRKSVSVERPVPVAIYKAAAA